MSAKRVRGNFNYSGTILAGVDEAGRGPLAGPLALAAVAIRQDNPLPADLLEGLKDSKQLRAPVREEWFNRICEASRSGLLRFSVTLVSSGVIDRVGISLVLRVAVARVLRRLRLPSRSLILLDWGLRAPASFFRQQSIKKGDESVSLIALASIMAKVTRDREMFRYSLKHPGYGFEIHKGYGTKLHIEKLRVLGPTPIHRLTFLRRIGLAEEEH